MFLFYLTTSLRYFYKNKQIFLLTLLELIVGFLCFIFIATYLYYEFSFDEHIKNSDRIYRLTTNFNLSPDNTINSALSSPVIAPILDEKIPEIENYTRISRTTQTIEFKENEFNERNMFWVDSTFFDVFQFSFIQGNSESALKDPRSVVITEDISKKIFKEKMIAIRFS